jgi:hydrogenase nickel incorporation protein HypA/HybF
MHEMPVTQGILNMALEHAQGHRVTDIYLRAGQFSAVVPSSVETFFRYLSKDTLAEGARLHFETEPLEMTCQTCGRRTDLTEWAKERPQLIMARAIAKGCACGSKNLRVSGGVSFGMVSVELEESAPPQ